MAENARKELFELVQADPVKAQALIAYENLLTQDKIAAGIEKVAGHVEALRIAITGPLHDLGDDTLRTDIAITDQLNRIAIALGR